MIPANLRRHDRKLNQLYRAFSETGQWPNVVLTRESSERSANIFAAAMSGPNEKVKGITTDIEALKTATKLEDKCKALIMNVADRNCKVVKFVNLENGESVKSFELKPGLTSKKYQFQGCRPKKVYRALRPKTTFIKSGSRTSKAHCPPVGRLIGPYSSGHHKNHFSSVAGITMNWLGAWHMFCSELIRNKSEIYQT